MLERFKVVLNETIAAPIIKFLQFTRQDDLLVKFIVWWMIKTRQSPIWEEGFSGLSEQLLKDRNARG